MPDIIIIFFNSPVRREESGLCDIDQSSAAPVFLICGVVSHCLLFTYHIGVEIRKSLEPVFPDQFILETFQMFLIAEGEHFFAGEEVNRTTKVRVCLVPVFCTVITDCIAVDDLFAALTKDIDVVVSDCFGDLHVCTVHGSESQGTVQHEFHVSGSGCFFGSKADLFRKIKEIPQQIQTEIQQDKADDYVSLMIFFRKEEEKYSKLVNGSNPPSRVKEKQAHQLLVNADNKVLFDGKFTSMDELKSAIIKNLLKSWEESSRQDAQVVFFQYDRGTEIAAITTILKEAKGAFEQIRADLSVTSTDKSKEHLDRLFPILLIEGAPKKYGLKELPVEERISGIVVTIHTSEGREVVKDFTLTELKQKVTAARAKQADPESLVVGLKIEKGCKIGFVTDVKQVLREASHMHNLR